MKVPYTSTCGEVTVGAVRRGSMGKGNATFMDVLGLPIDLVKLPLVDVSVTGKWI
jgi:hypothetical protein